MPNINVIKIMAGAAIGGIGAGVLGWRSTADNPNMDTEDRFAFATSSAVAGIVGGAVLGGIGISRLAKSTVMGVKGAARGTMGAFQAVKGIGSVARKMGAGKAPWLKGPAKVLGLAAATTGVLAYGARSNPQTAAYAYRNEVGEVEYNQRPVKQRMDMLGATGDMVFGLNNLRHG